MLTKKIPRIFMYHRFSEEIDELGNFLDKNSFKWQLALIKKKWNVYNLREYILKRKNGNKAPANSVILTIDDGYSDFYKFAFPELKKNKMPATLFPTANFVDHNSWLWPDIIRYSLENCEHNKIVFIHMGKKFCLNFSTKNSLQHSWKVLSDRCINLSDTRKWSLIEKIQKETGVSIPNQPPDSYSSVTWNQLKEINHHDIEIGSHTMNHPILTKISKNDCKSEIVSSMKILKENLQTSIKTFCYPNGGINDLNEDIIRQVKSTGYIGAVVGDLNKPNIEKNFDFFKIHRLAVGCDKIDFLWKLSGMESLIRRIRTKK
jgi:peptidoglycan/xylan/chitin deacetylase (PgdA/CDA1 family)